MPSCIISGCANRTDPKRKRNAQLELENVRKISFHKFPKELDKCQMWLTALELDKWNPSKTATICSEHFADSDFQNWCMSKRILKKTAVPSIYPLCEKSTSPASFIVERVESSVETHADKENNMVNIPASVPISVSEEKSTSPASFIVERDEASIETHVDKENDVVNVPASVPINVSEEVYGTPTCSVPVVRPVSTPSRASMVNSSTCITPKRLFNSPRKKRIREVYKQAIKLIRQQLYKSRQQQLRYKKRIQTLTTILHSLKQKNLMSSEDLEIIENFKVQ